MMGCQPSTETEKEITFTDPQITIDLQSQSAYYIEGCCEMNGNMITSNENCGIHISDNSQRHLIIPKNIEVNINNKYTIKSTSG